jgi:hypothetical protein
MTQIKIETMGKKKKAVINYGGGVVGCNMAFLQHKRLGRETKSKMISNFLLCS